MSNKIRRSIRFYAIDWIKLDGSHVVKDNDFLKRILKENPKLKYGESEQVIITEYPVVNLPHKSDTAWVLSRIRNTDYPQVSNQDGEQVEPLTLGEGKALRDPSHFIIFENGAIIGAESNKQSRDVATALQMILSTWVTDFGSKYGIKDVVINRVIRERITADMFKAVRSIQIKSSPNYVATLMKPDNSIESVLNMNEGVQITLGVEGLKKDKKKGRLDGIRNVVAKILEEANKATSTFTMLKIEGIMMKGDGRYEVVNVLDNVMVVKKSVVKLDDRTKGINPISMYESICIAYHENLSDIIQYCPLLCE